MKVWYFLFAFLTFYISPTHGKDLPTLIEELKSKDFDTWICYNTRHYYWLPYYTFKVTSATSSLECREKCLETLDCVSLNYKAFGEDAGRCELNNVQAQDKVYFLAQDMDYMYVKVNRVGPLKTCLGLVVKQQLLFFFLFGSLFVEYVYVFCTWFCV